jgi:hypothetical protein
MVISSTAADAAADSKFDTNSRDSTPKLHNVAGEIKGLHAAKRGL